MADIAYFVDLDDTIFQTKRKCRGDDLVLACDNGGVSNSYMQPHQVKLWKTFQAGIVIPVSARTLDQFRRVSITRKCSYASLYFGGMIITNGQIDRDYQQIMAQKLQNLGNRVSDYYTYLKEKADSQFSIFNTDGYYICIRYNEKFDYKRPLYEFVMQLDIPPDYLVYFHAYQAILIPAFVTKGSGVEYLLSHISPSLSIGVGDRLSDIGFMHLMDFSMYPADSDIANMIETVIDQ